MNDRIALVYPYFRTRARNEMLLQPTGMALLSACIKRTGLQARQFDCTFENIWRAAALVSDYNPAIVGIYVMATMSSNAMRMLTLLRSMLPKTLFVCGGPLPTLYPRELAGFFDAVFCGEADLSFPRFCRDYVRLGCGPARFKSRMQFGVYPGIFVLDNETVMSVPCTLRSESELGDLPLPDREGGDFAKYIDDHHSKRSPAPAALMTSYGCPYHCDFCSKPVFGDKFRRRPVWSIMDEARDIESLGYDGLWIADDCFTLDVDHMRRTCFAFMEDRLNLEWSCLSRVDAVDAETAFLMRCAGCTKVYLGLESGSDETLALMKKRVSVRQGVEAVRVFREAGIKTSGFFIVGYPGETIGSIRKTLGLALNAGLDEISFTVPYPLPGSALYERIGKGDPLSDWEVENEVKFLYDSEFDAKDLRRMIDDTYAEFERGRLSESA
jgi:anaerobic magnesium-protoporphyrin IX monomethyl ester cyclase